MDHFGIGAAMMGMVRVYQTSARRSGRTTAMLDSLKDGDRVVCASAKEADRLNHLARERGLKTTFITVPPREAGRVFERPPSDGRTIFDHSWVEQFYEMAVERASVEIDRLQKESSGFGEPHKETRQRALEIVKWRS